MSSGLYKALIKAARMAKDQNGNKEAQSAVKKRREELGLTQRDLSLLSGVTIQTISNIENGRYEEVRLTPRQFKGICKGLRWDEVDEIPDEWLPGK